MPHRTPSLTSPRGSAAGRQTRSIEPWGGASSPKGTGSTGPEGMRATGAHGAETAGPGGGAR
jgi:hypothetical protein